MSHRRPVTARVHFRFGSFAQALALLMSALLVYGDAALLAQQAAPPPAAAPAGDTAQAPEEAPKLPAEKLDALVAPIALYPDTLLAQCLVAATYPVEVIQAQQWLDKNKTLKGDELSKAAMKQDWDPSIQSLVSIPDALKVLAQDITWTTDLGDAFLAQQSEVMDSVQRMRGKAKGGGKLESNDNQKVETKVIESKETIIIQQSNPEVVVVPSYSPTVVYGAPPPYYPYPPLYYPPYVPGAAFVSFGIGVAIGVGMSGGWGCGWGGGGNNTVNINNNNNYVKNSNRTNNGGNRSGNSNWSHNSQGRGGAPYNNKASANKYGGSARGESRTGASSRDAGGRGGASPSASSRGAGGGGGASPSASSRGAGGGGGGGGGQVGGRSVSGGSGSGSGLSGSGGGSRGASSSSSRGSSSMGGSRGGSSGRSGGGGRGGGGRR